MKKIFQLLILFFTVLIFSVLGNYLSNGFTGIILGGFTGLVVNTIFSIINYKKYRFPRTLSILLIALAFSVILIFEFSTYELIVEKFTLYELT